MFQPIAMHEVMAMPAYLGGKFDMAGMKWYGSNAANILSVLEQS